MSKEDAKSSAAMSLLLGANSTLGIIAGLTLAATQKQREYEAEDEDEYDARRGGGVGTGAAVAADERAAKKKIPSRGNGAGGSLPTDTLTAPGGAAPLSGVAKKYSVHEQRDAIRKMQESNQILKQELAIEYRDAKTLLANDKRQRMDYLQKMTDTFTKKVDAAKKNIVKLDEQIAKREHELEALRQQQHHSEAPSGSAGQSSTESGVVNSSAGPSPAVAETGAAITRRLRSLENRLELTLVKRNEMDSINKHLRSHIEKVRKDRVIFDGIYKKLEKELSDFQSRHDASVEELKKATDAKDGVNHEIAQIQANAETEQRLYEQQFKELKWQIGAAMREVQERNALSGGYGLLGTLEDSSGTSSHVMAAALGSGGSSSAGGMKSTSSLPPSHNDSPLKRISALSSWKIGLDKALSSTNDNIVAKYDQVFAGIKQMTGINDITRIAEEITRKDEENFKRFKRVEELHREEVALKAQVELLTIAIEDFKAQEGIATGTTQKQQYRALEAKFHNVLEKNKSYDVEFEETTTKLTRMKSSIHSIHSMLVHANCAKNVDQFSQGSAQLTLGSHSARDVTDSNILEYLQAIEIFTSSLMKENHDASMANASALAPPGVSQAVASSPVGHGPSTLSADPLQKLRVQVPSFGGVNGVIILPASTSPQPVTDVNGRNFSLSKLQQQQQRKKTGRFELSSRKSLSQLQFAAALAAASNTNGVAAAVGTPPTPTGSFQDDSAPPNSSESTPSTAQSATSSTADCPGSMTPANLAVDEEDEERAYTYEELRQFAAKSIVKKREDPSSRAGTGAGSRGGSTASSPVKSRA